MKQAEGSLRVRPIAAADEAEIERSARWMRATLVEVEGEEVGTALYTMDWLRARLRWHLDPAQASAAVLLVEDAAGTVLGHTIVRQETDAQDGSVYGLISTTYVEPAARRAGVAGTLLEAGEQWFRARGLARAATWTSAGNAKLIGLYEKHGYRRAATHVHDSTGTPMIQLVRTLSA